MPTVDWARWMEVGAEERDMMMKAYRDQVSSESEANARRWNAMTPEQRSRYPEAADQ